MAGDITGAGPVDPLIGRDVIGQYIIRHKIGAGGMGAVYLAEQTAMGRNAVIKVLHPWLSKDPEVAARFDNEARAVARLSDPHIVQLYNYGDIGDGTLFLAMEHLDGRTLSAAIKAEGRLSVERAVNIACQICEALSEAHRHEIVHRDLKPANIMILDKPGGELVKVLDFGVAKLRGSSRTSTGQMIGTPRYMSPEQLEGKPVDGRSDLYALGLVVYEMLVGQPPFVADTPIAYVHMHMSQAPPPLASIAPAANISPALARVIMQALSKDAQDRPVNAAAFADALRGAMREPFATAEAAISAATEAPTIAIGVPNAPVIAVASAGDEAQGSRTGPAIVGVLAVALLGGGAYWAMSARGDEPPPAPPTTTPDPSPATTLASPATGPITAPTPSSAGGDTTADTSPLPPLSAETQALMGRSVPQLEKEFFSLLDNSYIPPSSKQQMRDSYGTMARGLVPGPAAQGQRKTYLVQVIIGYRTTPTIPPGFDLPIEGLEDILKELDAAATIEMRMNAYEEMVKGFNTSARSEDDRAYWRRYALVSLIETFSGDKTYLENHIK